MSSPPPKPPKPPPKPPKPTMTKEVSDHVEVEQQPENDADISKHFSVSNTNSEASSTSSPSRKTSIKFDEALRETVFSFSKTVFTRSEINKANLYEDSFRYDNDSSEGEAVATCRLEQLNNLFSLNEASTPSKKSEDVSKKLTGYLIREGYMTKKSRKSDDKVYAILTSEFFAYGSEEFRVTGPPVMEMRRVLSVATTLVVDSTLEDTPQMSVDMSKLSEDDVLKGEGQKIKDNAKEAFEDSLNQFCILSKDKSFTMQLPSREERQKWFQDIEAACSFSQKQNGKIFSQSEMAPVWRQDRSTTACEVCCRKFHFFFRKHHCRNCGKCVCENCLLEKIRIPSLDPRRLFKVCSACSVKLKEERNYMR